MASAIHVIAAKMGKFPSICHPLSRSHWLPNLWAIIAFHTLVSMFTTSMPEYSLSPELRFWGRPFDSGDIISSLFWALTCESVICCNFKRRYSHLKFLSLWISATPILHLSHLASWCLFVPLAVIVAYPFWILISIFPILNLEVPTNKCHLTRDVLRDSDQSRFMILFLRRRAYPYPRNLAWNARFWIQRLSTQRSSTQPFHYVLPIMDHKKILLLSLLTSSAEGETLARLLTWWKRPANQVPGERAHKRINRIWGIMVPAVRPWRFQSLTGGSLSDSPFPFKSRDPFQITYFWLNHCVPFWIMWPLSPEPYSAWCRKLRMNHFIAANH